MISSVDTVNLIDYDASVTISSNEKEPDKIINVIKNYSEVEKMTTIMLILKVIVNLVKNIRNIKKIINLYLVL